MIGSPQKSHIQAYAWSNNGTIIIPMMCCKSNQINLATYTPREGDKRRVLPTLPQLFLGIKTSFHTSQGDSVCDYCFFIIDLIELKSIFSGTCVRARSAVSYVTFCVHLSAACSSDFLLILVRIQMIQYTFW